jgi:pimeloyl-ACP methyl ester carboxylesterase
MDGGLGAAWAGELHFASEAEDTAASSGDNEVVPIRQKTTTMNYWVRGSGPPILFIHGIPTGGRLWDFVVERLEDKHTCIVVDLPGMGASPPLSDGSRAPGRFAEELDILGRDLGFTSWNVVGHDAGSTIAVHLAAAYPERTRRLALLSPPLFPEFRPPWFFRLLRMAILGKIFAPVMVLVIWNGGIQSIIERPDPALPEILESFRKPFRGLAGAGRLAWLVRWGKPAEVLGRTAAMLNRISAPTLILHGERDGAIPISFARRASRIIPDARVLFFDSGHFLPLNLPETIADQLRVFFGSGLEASPIGSKESGVRDVARGR